MPSLAANYDITVDETTAIDPAMNHPMEYKINQRVLMIAVKNNGDKAHYYVSRLLSHLSNCELLV
jgi:hypothetical protein